MWKVLICMFFHKAEHWLYLYSAVLLQAYCQVYIHFYNLHQNCHRKLLFIFIFIEVTARTFSFLIFDFTMYAFKLQYKTEHYSFRKMCIIWSPSIMLFVLKRKLRIFVHIFMVRSENLVTNCDNKKKEKWRNNFAEMTNKPNNVLGLSNYKELWQFSQTVK